MKTLIKAALLSVVLMIICGIIYPLAITGISQIIFPKQANGSIIEKNGEKVGSELLGQKFEDPRFFKGRVSVVNYNTYKKEDAVPDKDGKTSYTGVSSGSANFAPSNPALTERVSEDIDKFLKENPTVKKEDIPTDLLTSSGSGLDPHISPNAAKIQIPAISKATGISEADLTALVEKYTEGRSLGVFGEPRVNVLKLNLDITQIITP